MQRSGKRLLWISMAVAAVVVVFAGVGLWWFFRDDSPSKVNLADAVQSVDNTASDGSAAAPTVGDVDGTWTVDTTTGDFSFDSATGTFAGFRVQENLASVGSATAVGRTGHVSGTVTISGTTVTAADLQVDLTTITTNDSRRDSRVQSALETRQFPTATFSLTQPIELGPGALDGQSVDVTATGDLTVHGVTNQVQFPLQAQLVGDHIVAVGSINVTFSDYDVTAPTSAIALSVDDHGVVELQLLLTRN